jgi:hypothetical protein
MPDWLENGSPEVHLPPPAPKPVPPRPAPGRRLGEDILVEALFVITLPPAP